MNERILKNIEVLKSKNIPYNEDMKYIPDESNTKLDEIDRIFIGMINDYILATMATTENLDESFFDDIYGMLNTLYGVDSYLPDETKEILGRIKKKDPTVDMNMLSWLYEKSAIKLWALGIIDFPNQTQEVDTNYLNRILFMNDNNENSVPDLFLKVYDSENHALDLSKLNMRTFDEILEKADLLKRYKWAIDEARINNQNETYGLSIPVLLNQLQAFCEILNYDMNDSISR